MRTVLNQQSVRWGVSGVLFAVAFLHPWLWVLYIPAFVLFLEASRAAPTPVRALAGSWLVGTMKTLGALAWFWHTYPLTWIEIGPAPVEFIFVGFYWVTVSIAIGAGFIVFGLASHWFLRRSMGYALLLPAIVVVAEIVGSYVFSLLALGPGIVPNISFSFGYVGYLFAYAPAALGFAQFGGVYALSFVAALVGVLVYLAIHRTQVPQMLLGTSIVVFTLAWITAGILLVQHDDEDRGIRAATVVTNLTAYELTSHNGNQRKHQIVRNAVNAAFAHSPDILILPEGASFLDQFESIEDAIDHVHRVGVGTVVGSTNVKRDDGSIVLRAHVVDAVSNSVHYMDKRYLVPQGEHMIYFIVGLLALLDRVDIVEDVSGWALYPGEAFDHDNLPPHAPSVLFCTESVDPLAVRRIVAEREAPVIAHVTSHGWFHQTFLLRPQLNRMLRIQAVWNQVVIVEAGNGSDSKVYFPDGSSMLGERVSEGDKWQVYLYEL